MVLQLEFGLCGFACVLCFFVLNDCPSFLHILHHFLLMLYHFIVAKNVLDRQISEGQSFFSNWVACSLNM